MYVWLPTYQVTLTVSCNWLIYRSFEVSFFFRKPVKKSAKKEKMFHFFGRNAFFSLAVVFLNIIVTSVIVKNGYQKD